MIRRRVFAGDNVVVMQRPQVVAHRGSSEIKAEHTLGAYLAALEEGAEALECDVRLTADGHLVCVHDRDLRRTASTDGIVSTMSLAQLEDLDFASWKNPWADFDDEAVDEPMENSSVLTMRKLLETVADYPRPVQLAIETKHPTRYSGLVERRLVELLDDFGWAGEDSRARVMSFSLMACKRIEKLAPALDVVFLMDNPTQWPRSKGLRNPEWIAGPGIKLLRSHPQLAAKIARKAKVHVWTVNREEDIDLCLELGVSAIITDRPGAAHRYLDSMDL